MPGVGVGWLRELAGARRRWAWVALCALATGLPGCARDVLLGEYTPPPIGPGSGGDGSGGVQSTTHSGGAETALHSGGADAASHSGGAHSAGGTLGEDGLHASGGMPSGGMHSGGSVGEDFPFGGTMGDGPDVNPGPDVGAQDGVGPDGGVGEP